MNAENRRHGLYLMERHAKAQDDIDCLLRQIEECRGQGRSHALKEMLGLCVIQQRRNQATVQNAFLYFLDLDENQPQEPRQPP